MIGADGREAYRVVWPRGAKTVQATDVAPRLGTLEGKIIGQLWDDLFRGDEIFPILEEELTRRFPGVRFVRYDTFGSTHERVAGLRGLPGPGRHHGHGIGAARIAHRARAGSRRRAERGRAAP